MCLNYGPNFRRLWTKVHQITLADAGEITACNAVFRLSISYSVPEIFAIEERSRPKWRRKKHAFFANISGTEQDIDNRQSEYGVANYDLSRVC